MSGLYTAIGNQYFHRMVRGFGTGHALFLVVWVLSILLGSCATRPEPQPGSADTPMPENPETVEEFEDEEDRERLITITGVVLGVRRTSPPTVIILPPASFITDYLRDEPFTLPAYPQGGLRGDRFQFQFHLNTTDTPPFVLDRDRYIYPELYY